MTKLAVISDSHWGKLHLEMFARKAMEQDYTAVIHCGDGVSDARWLEKTLNIPVHYVAGNCDPHWSCDREKRLSFDGVNLVVLHGDKYNVKYELTGLSYHAEEIGAKVALFGHTHCAYMGCIGEILLLNPGALKEGCYAELVLDQGRIEPSLKVL